MRTLYRGTDRLYRTTSTIFYVVECGGCQLIRLYPWPAEHEIRQYYPEQYWYNPDEDAADSLAEAYRRLVLLDHIRFAERALRQCGEKGPVLDVGCGGGLFLGMLRKRGYPVIGLDFSEKAAAVAWHAKSVPTICASLADAPLPDESCAAVTMFHVLEHLFNPASYLEAAHRLLKPDGRLIVQVPNASSWQFVLLGENWSGLDVPRHLLDFRLRDLQRLLEYSGFEVLRVKHLSLRDNPAGLATSLAPWLDPMARRIRGTAESVGAKFLKDGLYFGLTLVCLPVALLEAACRAGSSVMVEARKKR